MPDDAPGDPSTLEEAFQRIQRHRMLIVEAQHKVLRREITMPQYNETYKAHLDAIHALEAKLAELQARGHGSSAAGLY